MIAKIEKQLPIQKPVTRRFEIVKLDKPHRISRGNRLRPIERYPRQLKTAPRPFEGTLDF